MSIFNRIFNRSKTPVEELNVTKFIVDEKALNMPVGSYSFSSVATSIGTTDYRTSWVKQAIDVRAANTANCEVYVINSNTGKEMKNHPFLDIFNASNIYDLSGNQLISIISQQLDVYGNGYLYVAKTNGRPTELIPLPSKYITPKYNSNNTMIVGYEYVGGNRVMFDRSEVIHFRNLSIDNFLVGTPTIAALAKVIDIDNFQQDFSKNNLINGGSISIALYHPGKIAPDVLNRMRYDFNKSYSGAENSGKTIVLDNGMTLQDFSKSNKDMDYTEGRKLTRDEILAKMGVPPVLLGINDSANRASAEVEYAYFVQHTIKNIASNIEQTFNNFIRNNYSGNYEVVMEYQTQTSDAKLKELDLLLKYGVITKDEVREQFDYAPLMEDDIEDEPATQEETETENNIEDTQDEPNN